MMIQTLPHTLACSSSMPFKINRTQHARLSMHHVALYHNNRLALLPNNRILSSLSNKTRYKAWIKPVSHLMKSVPVTKLHKPLIRSFLQTFSIFIATPALEHTTVYFPFECSQPDSIPTELRKLNCSTITPKLDSLWSWLWNPSLPPPGGGH